MNNEKISTDNLTPLEICHISNMYLEQQRNELKQENQQLKDRIFELEKEPTSIGLILVELERWLEKEVAYKDVQAKLNELKNDYLIKNGKIK